jgi:hypothetical protein
MDTKQVRDEEELRIDEKLGEMLDELKALALHRNAITGKKTLWSEYQILDYQSLQPLIDQICMHWKECKQWIGHAS